MILIFCNFKARFAACAFAVALICYSAPASADALAPLTPVQALSTKGLECVWSGNGRDMLSLTVNNGTDGPIEVNVPAGQMVENRARTARMIVLRSARLRVPARGSAEASLPAAALSSKNARVSELYVPISDAEPRLDSLLKFLSNQPDAPKETAQLAVLCVLEDMNFDQWQKFLAQGGGAEAAVATDALTHGARSAPSTDAAHPTPAEVTQAIDALGILRTITPGKAFAIANDSGLKLRALRNPWCRAKAMQLYGIALPAASGADGQVPDLGQLLHTKPGDNCPICRQRALMQQGGSDF